MCCGGICCREERDRDEHRLVNHCIVVLIMVLVVSVLMVVVSAVILATAGSSQTESPSVLSSRLKDDNCSLIYTAVQPNFVGQKTPVATLTRNICKHRPTSRRKPSSRRKKKPSSSSRNGGGAVDPIKAEKRRRRRMMRRNRRRMERRRKKQLKQQQQQQRRSGRAQQLSSDAATAAATANKTESSAAVPAAPAALSDVQLPKQKLKEFWEESEAYRDWKRRKSTELLLRQPASQLAIQQLWQQLIKKGDHWLDIYRGMHNQSFPFPLDTEIVQEDVISHDAVVLRGEAVEVPHLKHRHADVLF